jgi:hypothetical protein
MLLNVAAVRLALSAGPVAEILRAAAELELDAFAHLDAPSGASRDESRLEWRDDHRQINDALRDVLPAAPHLARCEISLARPLPLRGRAFGRSIVVGFPGIAGAEASFCAWQAAHEATVLEIGAGAFVDVERRALARLRARARRADLEDAHARWLSRIDLSALGPISDVDDVGDRSA